MTAQPHILPMIEISTAHVKEHTCNVFLQQDNCPVCAYQFEYGWFIYVPDEDCDQIVPLDLKKIFIFARTYGCNFIKLDCDGTLYSTLPTYEWK